VTQSAMLVSDSTAEMPWWLRAHRALMPDYNAKAASFWWLIVLLGSATLAHALMQVAAMPLEQRVQVFIGIGFATMSGLFPVMIPRMKNSFAAGEIFIFLLLLLHGPAAAAVAAACETAVGSYRSSKRWTSRIFSPANSALAIAAAGQALQAMRETLGHAGLASDGMLLLAAMGMAVLYFAMNIIGVVTVPLLKNNGRFAWRDLVGNFGWVGVAYGASASVATLLYLTFMQSGTGVLMAALPIIALLMATLHFYFRQSEADEVVRKSRVEAAEREAEQAARHVRELRHMAFHDSLTGLPNRTRFNDELAQAIDRVRAEPSYQFAVMFLDFDRFKLINDSLGHAVGDEFLVQVSRRIREHVRPQDVVARLGGDEFAVLLGGIDGEAAATSLAERLLAVLRQPLRVAGTELATSASIGITFSSFGYTSPGDVLREGRRQGTLCGGRRGPAQRSVEPAAPGKRPASCGGQRSAHGGLPAAVQPGQRPADRLRSAGALEAPDTGRDRADDLHRAGRRGGHHHAGDRLRAAKRLPPTEVVAGHRARLRQPAHAGQHFRQ
jgi:diguanylate cyclase (GGDEF)-like protein